MKTLIIGICTLVLSGCVAVPAQQKWPDIPKDLKESCPSLLTVKGESVEIVNFMEVVVLNYGLYHSCVIKNQGWMKWYNEQKENYEKKLNVPDK